MPMDIFTTKSHSFMYLHPVHTGTASCQRRPARFKAAKTEWADVLKCLQIIKFFNLFHLLS